MYLCPVPSLLERLRRLPWIAIGLSAAVVASGFASIDPVINGVTRGQMLDAHLDRSAGYVALGPISGILDAITLFGVGQHIAFGVWLIGGYLGARVWLGMSRGTTVKREGVMAAGAFACLFALYAAVA